mgnify:CR=1 FL=1|jgi:universal stress protein A
MSLYTNIVVAIDPIIDSQDIIDKAKNLIRTNGIINIVYVDEHVPMAFMGAPLAPPMMDYPFDNENKAELIKSMQKLALMNKIPKENVNVLIGSPANEIRRFAKKISADCIVLGTHGRHGVALLLGSTASSVVHGTPCDILAVKIKDKK